MIKAKHWSVTDVTVDFRDRTSQEQIWHSVKDAHNQLINDMKTLILKSNVGLLQRSRALTLLRVMAEKVFYGPLYYCLKHCHHSLL